MVLHVTSLYNEQLQCFTAPKFDDHDIEAIGTMFGRQLLAADEKIAASYKGMKLYYIGDFDDLTGQIKVVDKKLILDCDQVIKARGTEVVAND